MKRMTCEHVTDRRIRAALRQWRSPLICAVVAVTWAAWGCEAPSTAEQRGPTLTAEEAINMPLEENILSVAASYPLVNPWLLTDDRSRVRGIIISGLYLGGPNHLGVFGDGIIRPRVYVLDTHKKKPKPPQLVKEWSFDPDQALPFRSKRRTMVGYGYRFHLFWDDELDLTGKDIRVTVVFERRDGTLIQSGQKEFRVPAGGL